MNTPQTPPQKKGLSGLAIALIIIGILLVLGMGTCAVGVYFVKKEATKLTEGMADGGGGLMLESPAEVKAELAAGKKDYVGSWKSARGSTLDIDENGNFKLVYDEGGVKETLTAPIGAFRGNDIQIRIMITITVAVSSPPQRVGDHFTMTAKGTKFERK